MASETYERIWKTVKRIPKGRVATYGQIAHVAGLGSRARQVGYALHSLPDGSNVPWHRVINSQGKISLQRAGGYDEQRTLLEAEGVEFDGERVRLDRFQWRPRRKTKKKR